MNGIRVLVVEDEILIANTIQLYIEQRGHSCVDIAISYDESVAMYNKYQPDVVILDVRLYGEKSGIDFANYLMKNNFKTPYIFLTSQFDKNALKQVINTKPAGYLTKPIIKESLWTTIEIAHNNYINSSLPKCITINDGNKTHLIEEDHILYIQAEHVYITFFIEGNKQVVSRFPLSQMLETLDSNIFYQCHRSFIINTKKVSSWSNNTLVIDHFNIPISRSRKNELLSLLAKGPS